MAQDKNVKTLQELLIIFKTIIDQKKEDEFIEECKGKENLFIIATQTAHDFVKDFGHRNQLNFKGTTINTFSAGFPDC